MVKKWCWQTEASARKTPGDIGAAAEQLAENYICRQGLKFIARNVSYPFGELDLIVEDREELVFVEVRFRSNSNYGSAAETVSIKKQKRLLLAAQRWLADNQRYQNHYCRFDLIAIDSFVDSKHLIWEKNAFQAPAN